MSFARSVVRNMARSARNYDMNRTFRARVKGVVAIHKPAPLSLYMRAAILGARRKVVI